MLFDIFLGANSKMTDLTFERAVTVARETKSDRILSNRSLTHASHVVFELFNLAIDLRVDVKMSSGFFNPGCYNSSIVSKAKELMKLGCRIDGVAEKQYKDKIIHSEFATLLSKAENERASLRIIDPQDLAGNFLHFTLVGDTAYRFEQDHDLAKALLSFNRPETVSSLKEEFELYKSFSIAY